MFELGTGLLVIESERLQKITKSRITVKTGLKSRKLQSSRAGKIKRRVERIFNELCSLNINSFLKEYRKFLVV